jgi:hypothetical protein
MYALLRLGPRGIFNYFGADAFLYMTVAKRSSLTWYSFDGETATNGFHPLWGFLLTALHSVTGSDAEHFLVAAFLLSLAVTSLGVALTSVAIFRYTSSIFLSLLTVPGIYYLVLGAGYQNWAIWAGSAGLEGGVSILSGGILVWVISRECCREGFTLESMYDPSFRGIAWRLGLVLPLVMLSRLDDVFVIPCFFLVFLLTPGVPFRDRIRPAFNVVIASTLVLFLYFVFNKAYAGAFMPVSGSVKSKFTLFQSFYVGLSNMFPFLIDLKEAVTGRPSDPEGFSSNAFRFVQIVGPALMSVIYIWGTAVHHKRNPRFILPLAIAVGLLVKLFYNIAFVNLWDQGSWYYALSISMTSFLFCILIGEPYAQLDARGFAKRALYVAYAVILAFAMGREILRSAYIGKNPEYDFWVDRVATQEALDGIDANAKLLELGDGIVAFSLEAPAMHGFGFSGDKDTVVALHEGRLLAHAHQRGYDILASSGYVPVDWSLRDAEQIRARLGESAAVQPALRAELDSFDFELLWVHEPTRTGFIRFTPRTPVGAE